jgi:hypothetical protein
MNDFLKNHRTSDAVLTEITRIFHRALLGRMASLIILGVGLATAPNVCAQIGIASRYPNDKGIGSDPDVLLADDFESYTSTSQLTTKWTQAAGIARLRIATESGHYFAGAKGLEMKLPISTTETACGLVKNISPTFDTLFMRMYQKWDTTYHTTGSNHNGILMSAKYPGPGTGTPANGTGWYLFQLDDDNTGRTGESDPGFDHMYSYWPKQRDVYGDLWFPDGYVQPYSNTTGNQGDWLAYPNQYPNFKAMPNHLPERGRWYCYEMMVKANTPGQNNGEVKWWVDGKVLADFPNLNVRSIATLKIDTAKITLDVNKNNPQVITKWHDNVVIATKYIGPMASGSPSPSPTNRLETESLKVAAKTPPPNGITSAQWFGVFNATAASGGAGTYFNANAPGQLITYTVPVAMPGTYHVRVGVQTKPNKGTFKLAINGVSQGSVQDEYNASVGYAVRGLGTVYLNSGNQAFKFTVAGKNASSTGYTLAFDYIELVP